MRRRLLTIAVIAAVLATAATAIAAGQATTDTVARNLPPAPVSGATA
jgi:hypothetical protein